MAIDVLKFIKGLIVADVTDPTKELQLQPGSSSTTGTKTILQSSQTSNVTLTLPDATDTLVGKATMDTLTNKTLTSPVINSPTGITKTDVGLGNVDNTSDATKNAASVTLTNKTLTTPVINSPTGIVKADVGLGNVDNTSDATKNAASATLTNKTLTTPVITSISNSGTITIPTGTDTLVGKATTDTLTNKSISGSTNTLTAIPLTTAVTGILPIANGGTNSTATATNGGIGYGTGSAHAYTSAGNSGDVLTSTGVAAPIWMQSIQADMATNYSFTTSVSAGAFTITLKDAAGNTPSATSPARFAFRNSSVNIGDYSMISVTGALSLVIPSGATLGHANGISQKDYIYLINNAGTLELAVMGYYYPENLGDLANANTGLITTTAITTGADLGSVMYSTSARTSVAYRLIGKIESNQATAGNWTSSGALSTLPLSRPYEIVTTEATGTAPTTTGVVFAVTGFNVRLTPGIWRLSGWSNSFRSSGTADATAFLCQWSDTSASINTITSSGKCTLISGPGDYASQILYNVTAENDAFAVAVVPHIILVKDTMTVYINATVNSASNVTGYRVRGGITAERIQ